MPTRHLKVLPQEFTAQAFITTDLDDNQITAFHPGAMTQSHLNKVTDARDVSLGIISPDGRDGSVTIHADASIRAGLLDGPERLEQPIDPARITYVHAVRGSLRVNDRLLRAGDAARLDNESKLVLEAGEAAEVLVFDLAP